MQDIKNRNHHLGSPAEPCWELVWGAGLVSALNLALINTTVPYSLAALRARRQYRHSGEKSFPLWRIKTDREGGTNDVLSGRCSAQTWPDLFRSCLNSTQPSYFNQMLLNAVQCCEVNHTPAEHCAAQEANDAAFICEALLLLSRNQSEVRQC